MFSLKEQTDLLDTTDLYTNSLHIDFHSHILPFMDDGCKSSEESIELLKMTRAQGVGKIVATPHFYPTQEDPDSFLERRSASLNKLIEALEEAQIPKESIPEVYVGAEVAYFSGIAGSATIDKLCVLGTKLLLVELPFATWSESVIEEIITLQRRLDIVPVIAHVERYISFQTKNLVEQLMLSDLLIQSNCSAFLNLSSKRFVLRELKRGCIDLLGSDAHNLTNRTQTFGKAIKLIEKRLGVDAVNEIMKFGNYILENAERVI